MRDRIISNVLIKMGNRIKKKELDYLENVLKMALIKRGVYNECRYEISKRLFDQFISE